MTLPQVEKILDIELPIPTAWRSDLKRIIDAITDDDFPDRTLIPVISDYDADILEINSSNIADYPDGIGPLEKVCWETSVYIWAEQHWDILIDLTDNTGKNSDLVFHAKVREQNGIYKFEPGLIYVP